MQWRRHRIKAGETLSHIAQRYRTTVATLCTVNEVESDRIRSGTHLLIPVASAERGVYQLSAEQRVRRTQSSGSGQRIDYRVRSGDTLWDISRAHDVKVRKLARWNSMSPADPIRPGQRLIIWKTTAAQAAGRDMTRRTIRYTVRRGDSLDRISRRFRVTIEDLRRWNQRALTGKYIHPGQRLTLYVDVTRQTL